MLEVNESENTKKLYALGSAWIPTSLIFVWVVVYTEKLMGHYFSAPGFSNL